MKAMQIKAQIAVGESLVEEDVKIKHSLTFEKMFEEYMERYSKKEKLSWKYDDREVRKYLKHWFKKQATDITKEEIARKNGDGKEIKKFK